MPTTEAEQQENDEVESLEREGISLRWAGHRLYGANIGLRQRLDATMDTLESRSDVEARAVMLRLAREFREMNGELTAHLSRMSMLNLGVVEMLRKSRDGRAALMMRSAAEILVKGLANAEEEVCALKASLKEVEGQRDAFKNILAKTNSELEASQAYDQLSKAVGQESATTTASSTSKVAATAEGVVTVQSPAKGNAPGRQEQQTFSGNDGGVGGSSSGSGGASIAAADGRNQSGVSSGIDQGSGTGGPRAGTRKRQRGASKAGAAVAVPAAASAAAAAAAALASAGAKRKRGDVVGVGDGAIRAGDEGMEETNRQKKQRKGGGREEGLGNLGRKGDGVDLTLSQEDPGRWVEPWKDGGRGGVAGGGDGDIGGGSGDAASEGDLQGVYDSDDAPSMFF